MITQPGKEFQSLREVAARFGVNPRTLRRWVDAGEFPRPIQLGRKLQRFLVADIERYIADRQRVQQP